jgi:hypothetical protein
VSLDCIDTLAVEDLGELFRAFEAAAKVGPFVVLTDTLHMKAAPRAVISAFSEGMKKRPLPPNTWLGDAVVVRSPAVRFILSTLLVVAPMPTEVKAFDKRTDAMHWCEWILRRAGLAVPPALMRSA